MKLNSGWQRTNPLSPRIEDLNLPPPAYESSALTTWLHCLLCIGTVLSIRFEEGGYLSKSPTREYHKITISLLLSITSVQNKLASNRVFSVKLCRWSLNIHILYKNCLTSRSWGVLGLTLWVCSKASKVNLAIHNRIPAKALEGVGSNWEHSGMVYSVWVEEITARVKCLAHEHNTMTHTRLKLWPLNLESTSSTTSLTN